MVENFKSLLMASIKWLKTLDKKKKKLIPKWQSIYINTLYQRAIGIATE